MPQRPCIPLRGHMLEQGSLCRAARAALNLSLDDLSKATALARLTIWHHEKGKKVRRSSEKLILDFYTSKGVSFEGDGNYLQMTIRKPDEAVA